MTDPHEHHPVTDTRIAPPISVLKDGAQSPDMSFQQRGHRDLNARHREATATDAILIKDGQESISLTHRRNEPKCPQ
jgi:hypothetical protein